MSERSKLKKTIIDQIDYLEREIAKMKEYIDNGKNVDYKVCYTRLLGLQQCLQFINEINDVCVDRNRY